MYENRFRVIPIENSMAGNIDENHDLLLAHPLVVNAEAILPVRHCLMALPGTEISSVKKVISHPQALAQCESYLRDLAVETVAVYDTAGGARMIRQESLKDVAAIASRKASELYDLTILREGIQDRHDNMTRFYLISKDPVDNSRKPCKTALIFATAHAPGGLARCLQLFAEKNINLLRLASRPSKNKPWEYMFYLDFDGHLEDPVCAEAIKELKEITNMLKILGSFPKCGMC